MTDKLVTNSLSNSAITGNVISSGAVVSSKIATGAITLAKLEPEFASKFAAGVKVTNLYYDGLNTFADVDGGQTITLVGSGFSNNSQVVVNKTMASNVLVTNQYFLTFLAPPNPRGSYSVFVDNQNGATSFLPFGINYIPLIKFYSPSGFFGNLITPDNSVYEQISAIGDGALTFTLESGSLPSGITLNSNGSITGSTAITSVGNYNFNVSIFDNNLNKIYRDFFVTLAGGVRLTNVLYSTPSQGNLSAVITGGDTVTFVGGPFLSGGNIIVGNAAARAFTFSSSTTISFTTVATTAGTYDVRINNTNGTYAFRRNFLTFRPPLTWTTPAGLIGTLTELYPFNFSLSASTDASITYSIVTGNLPTGISLNSNGLITGTAISGQANVSSLSTYTLTVLATGAFGQNATRTFTVNLYSALVITGFVFPNNTLAANVGGGQVVTVNGTGFKPGVTLYLDNVIISSTRVASNQLTFTTPAKPIGNYNVYIRNTDATTSSNVAMKFSSVPVWGASSVIPNIDSNFEYSSNIFAVSAATSDSSILYYLATNINLPTGIIINANTGILSGNTSIVSNLTYGFSITAVDSELQTSIKNFTVGLVGTPVISQTTFKYFDVEGGLIKLKGNDFSRSAVINFDGSPATIYYQDLNSIVFFAPKKLPGRYPVYITQGVGLVSNTLLLEATDPEPGQIEYTVPGTYTFSYNSFFSNISVVAVGGGGGGVVAGGGGGSSGGGGGGLAWINGLTAYPDDTFTVVVGGGGAGGFNALGQYQGTSGSLSYFGNTSILVGYGGTAPDGSGYTLFPSTLNIPMKTGGRGGAYFASNAYGTYGGGDGGDAGDTATATQFAFKQGGGGGAGGYLGKGGSGGGFNSGGGAATLNSGGGGGGSGTSVNVGGGGGGGVGIYGKGVDGAGGGNGQDFFNGGTGGSSGTNGGNGGTKDGGAGGSYGAGGGGAGGGSAPTAGSRAGSGSVGAVRVIWGESRSFPDTNTANVRPIIMGTTGGNSIITLGSTYTTYVNASVGTGNISYSVYSGNLPPGMTLTSANINGNITGVVSGVTTGNANINVYSFNIRAIDSAGTRKTSNSYAVWITDQIQSLPFDPFNNFLAPNLAPVWVEPVGNITVNGIYFSSNIQAYGLSSLTYSITNVSSSINGATFGTNNKTISGNVGASGQVTVRATDLAGRFTDKIINIVTSNFFSIEYMIIGGGGGTSLTSGSGGGGAGGVLIGNLLIQSNNTITESFTITVGGGGVQAAGSDSAMVRQLNNSTYKGLGGGVGGATATAGGAGGSGGGGGRNNVYDFTTQIPGGAATQPTSQWGGYGNPGGYGFSYNWAFAGPGGGATSSYVDLYHSVAGGEGISPPGYSDLGYADRKYYASGGQGYDDPGYRGPDYFRQLGGGGTYFSPTGNVNTGGGSGGFGAIGTGYGVGVTNADYQGGSGIVVIRYPGFNNINDLGGNVKILTNGGNITVLNGYVYHQFPSSGTFTFARSVDSFVYLAVAGGGGGGSSSISPLGGGGGGGGIAEGNVIIQKGTIYTITVGAGGTAASNNTGSTYVAGSNGGNTSISSSAVGFGNIVAIGGGCGGSRTFAQGGFVGGSGGGAAGFSSVTTQTGASGITGGSGGTGVYLAGGGGGGASGATGGSGIFFNNKYTGGTGAAGKTITSLGPDSSDFKLGSPWQYAGGGGAGGSDLGGDGGGFASFGGGYGGRLLSPSQNDGGAGAALSGGGGGGGLNGGNGGSGRVIIRTLISVSNATISGSVVFSQDGDYKSYAFNGTGTITWN